MSEVRAGNIQWGLIDQGLYSGTNVLLAILVARSVDAENFGAFSLAFILFILFVGSCRSYSGGPLLIRFGAKPPDTVRVQGARAIAAAALIGAVIGGAVIAIGLIAGGIYQGPMVWLGATLSPLLAQDAIRSTFFAMERPARAALNDGVWATLQIVGVLVVLNAYEDPPATYFVAAWCIAGTGAFLFGLAQLRLAPSMIRLHGWLSEISDLGQPLLYEYLLAAGPGHLLYLLAPAVAGAAALGVIRGAYVFYGPLNVVHEASQMLFIPAARRAGTLPAIRSLSRKVTLAMAGVAIIWMLAVGFLPDAIGEFAIGDIWEDTSVVRWILGISLIAEAAIAGIGIALRAVERPTDLVRARAFAGPVIVVVGLYGGATWGAPGLALGFAVGYTLTALLSWQALNRVTASQLEAIGLGATTASDPIVRTKIVPWPT